MRRLSSPFKNRCRALAVELLEERNAPTPMSAAAIEPPWMGSGLERTNEPFTSSRSGREGYSGIAHEDFIWKDPLPGGVTPANHLQIAPAPGSDTPIQTVAAPAPQTFVGNAALSGPQLFNDLQQSALDSFVLQTTHSASGGIPGGSFASSGFGAGNAAGMGGGGSTASQGGGSAAATGLPASDAGAGLGGAGFAWNFSSPVSFSPAGNSPSQVLAATSGTSAANANVVTIASTSSSLQASPTAAAPTSGTPGPSTSTLSPGIIPNTPGQVVTSVILPTLYANTAAESVLVCLSGRGDKDIDTVREHAE